jgi:hypothetical protein
VRSLIHPSRRGAGDEAGKQSPEVVGFVGGEGSREVAVRLLPDPFDLRTHLLSARGEEGQGGTGVVGITPALDEPGGLEPGHGAMHRRRLDAERLRECALAEPCGPGQLEKEQLLTDVEPQLLQACAHPSTMFPGSTDEGDTEGSELRIDHAKNLAS